MNAPILTTLFPIMVLFASGCAWYMPSLFASLGNLIVPALVVIMFAMGLTITEQDFRRVFRLRKIVALGVAVQFLVMPFAAFSLSILLGLSNDLLIGMVLVGCVSGGTASNVICYLARADVALSVCMTLMSTLVAVIALPILTLIYLEHRVPVPVIGLLYSATTMVLLPVLAGSIINRFASGTVSRITPILPLITTTAIVFVIAVVVALNHEKLATIGVVLLVAVMAHNLIGMSAGYLAARWAGQNKEVCRTIAIEVGMQNSGLAVALAIKHFSVTAALPGALFSVWHNLSGSVIAAVWSANASKSSFDAIDSK